MFNFNDQKYKSRKDCCDKLLPNIDYSIIKSYTRRTSWEQAINHYLENGSMKFKFRETIYNSRKDCCRKLIPNVPYNTVAVRSKKEGWDTIYRILFKTKRKFKFIIIR